MNDDVIYEFSGHRLDPARRQLSHGGKPVAMFPRCFDALLLLVEHRGELLDKDFLLQALWPDVVVDENSLAKVVSDIRRALGEGARDSGCIVTVPRRGYRFVADVGVLRNVGVPRIVGGTPTTSGSHSEGIRALAVLPLNFLNPAAGDETLSLGLADALITRLGQLRHTVLRPTSSIARYAGATYSPAQAGRELGVDAVITGSIRRAGATLRVSMQLVAVAGDAVAWGEKFDAEGAGALALEDSIAERVATALTLALSRDAPPAARRHRADPDAYEHFIRGRYLIAKRTRASLFEAVACMERAIAIDPQFALAHAGLSDAWIQLGLRAAVSQSLRPREVMPKARAAAEKALTLDDALSEAHATLGQVLFTYEWKRPAGIAELQRAIELNPNNQNAQHWYAMALGGLGRFDQALDADPARAGDRPAGRHRQRQRGIPVVSRRAHRRGRRQTPAHGGDGAGIRDDALPAGSGAGSAGPLRRGDRRVRSHATLARGPARSHRHCAHACAHGPAFRRAAAC